MWCSNDNERKINTVKSMLLFDTLEVLHVSGREEFLGLKEMLR